MSTLKRKLLRTFKINCANGIGSLFTESWKVQEVVSDRLINLELLSTRGVGHEDIAKP